MFSFIAHPHLQMTRLPSWSSHILGVPLSTAVVHKLQRPSQVAGHDGGPPARPYQDGTEILGWIRLKHTLYEISIRCVLP